mmetsp:Transcript_33051/g.39990  ORF Transcript_33051/g.39990 Transcript_33051/m.39990 type:complete len:108 (+) Transcript_33051:1596-1919(+)
MLHFHFLEDRCCIAGNEESVKMVDNHLVHAMRSYRSTSDLRELLSSLNILDHGFLNTRQVLVSILQQARQAPGSTHGIGGSELRSKKLLVVFGQSNPNLLNRRAAIK